MQIHPESTEAIAQRLVAVREAWPQPNQAAFARFLELTPQNVNNYEKAVSRPNIDAALAYVRKTGITLDYIYRDNRAGLSVLWLEKLSAYEAAKATPAQGQRSEQAAAKA